MIAWFLTNALRFGAKNSVTFRRENTNKQSYFHLLAAMLNEKL